MQMALLKLHKIRIERIMHNGLLSGLYYALTTQSCRDFPLSRHFSSDVNFNPNNMASTLLTLAETADQEARRLHLRIQDGGGIEKSFLVFQPMRANAGESCGDFMSAMCKLR